LKTLGDHLRKRRLDLGLTQKQAAKMMGAHALSVVNWEKNYAQPSIGHMAAAVAFMGYSPFAECDNMAQRLVNLRKAAGLTQEFFARQLGVDPSTLARWERGEREPKGEYLDRIIRIVVSPA
jgi:transcriptional regulator with XRE-family HTH domain